MNINIYDNTIIFDKLSDDSKLILPTKISNTSATLLDKMNTIVFHYLDLCFKVLFKVPIFVLLHETISNAFADTVHEP